MVGVNAGVRRVFVRRLDRAEAIALPDVGANDIAFSSDGVSVAVLSASGLITPISLADQQRKALTSGATSRQALAWSQAGIVFARGGGLWIVSSEGGAPHALTVLDAARDEIVHASPVVLPGERLVLFASQTTEPGAERIESVSIDGGLRSVVVERAATPVWSPTGHLLFSRDGAVVAIALSTCAPERRAARPYRFCRASDRWARLQSTGIGSVVDGDPGLPAVLVQGHARGLGEPRRRGPRPRPAAIESVCKPSHLAGRATAPGRNWWQGHRGARPCAWHAGTAYAGDAERPR